MLFYYKKNKKIIPQQFRDLIENIGIRTYHIKK